MHAFDYVRPASLADAVKAFADGNTRFLAGGQTLIPTMKQRLSSPDRVVDLGGLAELKGIHRDEKAIGVGAMTTHLAVSTSADIRAAIPALAKLAGGIGDSAVRSMGTIGGSLANNDPAADYPAAALALGATIVTTKRQIPADDFFQGMFTTALEDGEIITAIGFPIPKRAAYAKYEQRASRYALVGVFVAETAKGVRVAVTGAGSNGVFRSPELEAALTAAFTADAAKGVKLDGAGMLGDLHASGDYRAAMVSVMAAKAVESMLA